MAKAPTTTTQDEPTRPQPVDARGRVLDEFGLPLAGPDRIEMLAGRTDPAIDPTGWADPAAPAAPQEN